MGSQINPINETKKQEEANIPQPDLLAKSLFENVIGSIKKGVEEGCKYTPAGIQSFMDFWLPDLTEIFPVEKFNQEFNSETIPKEGSVWEKTKAGAFAGASFSKNGLILPGAENLAGGFAHAFEVISIGDKSFMDSFKKAYNKEYGKALKEIVELRDKVEQNLSVSELKPIDNQHSGINQERNTQQPAIVEQQGHIPSSPIPPGIQEGQEKEIQVGG